jgi:hypothetical protein
MRKEAEKAMDDQRLAHELERIEAACSQQRHDGGLCLVRLGSGLDAAAWRRLRENHGLNSWRAAPAENLADALEDPETRLRRTLAQEIARARLCQQPLALALIEPEAEAANGVFELARAQLRLIDFAVRLAPTRVALVLSGTPLAAAERLLAAMLRRIRQVSEPPLVSSAGLVGYGGLADLDDTDLLDRAQQALAEAKRLGGNRLEVAPSADAELASRETLVRACEKHFLFTGKKLPE